MSEKEYIEREAALNAIKSEIDSFASNYFTTPYEFVRRGLQMAYSIIKNQPTAYVQEVVRCKGRAWGKYDDDLNMILCKRIYNLSDGECVYNDLNDFCSYGAKIDKE